MVVSCYQILSEAFIREFADKIDWDYLSLNENINFDVDQLRQLKPSSDSD
ncbi:MAG: hypothetical protein SPG52_08370 [Candidatus Cryptobacteroides sp.]|nr:hypothetical protein [Candidatus Cryptobacteroides sp.]